MIKGTCSRNGELRGKYTPSVTDLVEPRCLSGGCFYVFYGCVLLFFFSSCCVFCAHMNTNTTYHLLNNTDSRENHMTPYGEDGEEFKRAIRKPLSGTIQLCYKTMTCTAAQL